MDTQNQFPVKTEEECHLLKFSVVGSSRNRFHEKSRHSFNLLELPVEILLKIMINLPSSSLSACMLVDPLLATVIRDNHFLDSYTRRVLGLSDIQDKDVTFRDVPQETSLLMELWFLTHDAHPSKQTGSHIFRPGNDIFFSLDCFHHSLQTWLVQSTDTLTHIFNNASHLNSNFNFSLSKYVGNLPTFVKTPLTKLIFAFPDLKERTISAPLFSLNMDGPKTLQDAWHDGVPSDIKDSFIIQFSLEIICGDSNESSSYQSAILIAFSKERWVVWAGNVTQFPGCRFEKTHSLTSLKAESTVSEIRAACIRLKEFVCEHAKSGQNLNGQWKRQVFYPGLCYYLNHSNRKGLISSVTDKINETNCILVTISLARNLISSPSNHMYTPVKDKSDNKTYKTIPYNIKNGHKTLDAFKTGQRSVSQRHKRIPTSPNLMETKKLRNIQHFDSFNSLLLRHIYNFPAKDASRNTDIKSFLHQQNWDLKNNMLLLESSSYPENTIKCNLKHLLNEEILRYLCDFECHQIICPSCSKLWFPSNESLTTCIDNVKSREEVPLELWPYHVLADVAILLSETCY